jgi:predicted component of type VI protein secretion system
LVVHVEEPDSGASWDYVFEAGPVIVGRGDQAGLRIDRPFVSLHHGTFDFDDDTATYVDLDSRNGTLIDGVPRAIDGPVPLSEATDIRIGKLRLQISRAAPQSPPAPGLSNPFVAKAVANASKKQTDALPREELDRIRRELAARRPPPPVDSALDRTAPMPSLPRVAPPVPVVEARQEQEAPVASPYAAGGTKPVSVLPPEINKRPSRSTRPRASADIARSPRPAVRAGAKPRRLWLPLALVAVLMSAAALLLVTSGSRGRRQTSEAVAPPAPLVTAP